MASLRLQGLRGRSVDGVVPAALRPLVKAYVFGYASSTTPRLLSLLLIHLRKNEKDGSIKDFALFRASLLVILKNGLEWQRFPTFCAALIGGSTLLQVSWEPDPLNFTNMTRSRYKNCLPNLLEICHETHEKGRYPECLIT